MAPPRKHQAQAPIAPVEVNQSYALILPKLEARFGKQAAADFLNEALARAVPKFDRAKGKPFIAFVRGVLSRVIKESRKKNSPAPRAFKGAGPQIRRTVSLIRTSTIPAQLVDRRDGLQRVAKMTARWLATRLPEALGLAAPAPLERQILNRLLRYAPSLQTVSSGQEQSFALVIKEQDRRRSLLSDWVLFSLRAGLAELELTQLEVDNLTAFLRKKEQRDSVDARKIIERPGTSKPHRK